MSTCNPEAELDPRVRRTRRLLQDALRELLREKRFASISVAEIAGRATVNRNTFYAHYPDKFALLGSVLRSDLTRRLHARFKERPAFTRANFATFAAVVIAFLGEVQSACPRGSQEAESLIYPAIQEEIREKIDALLPPEGSGVPFPSGSRDAAVTVLSWSLFGCAYEWSRGPRERSADLVARELVEMLLPAPK